MAALTGREVIDPVTAQTATRARTGARRDGRMLWRALHVLSDAGLAFAAFGIAYWLRYRLEIGGDVLPGFTQPFSFFVGKAALFMVVAVLMFRLRGLYRLPRWTSLLDEASTLASAATTAMAIVILYSFLQRFYPSRLIFIYAWVVLVALLLLKRVLVRGVRALLWRRGIATDRVLIVGAGRAGQRMMQYILNQPQLGYRVVGFVDDVPVDSDWGIATERRVERPQYLGAATQVGEVVQAGGIDEVIIALPPNSYEQTLSVIDTCRELAVGFTFVPDLFDLALDRVQINEVAGLPLIGLQEARIRGWNYGVKRAMDIVIATLVLSVGAPIMLAIAVAIRLDSEGPILFRQIRVGKNGRRFTCYKFRSMCRDAEQRKAELQAAHSKGALGFKLPDDPRRTRVGRLLRRTSLDELPQFINVLLGEMSVVGPRPPVPSEVEAYDEWHYERLMVTPGLTGLWQVNGRSDLTFDEMVKLDLYYAEHWSPWLDLKLILRTVPAVLSARGAY